MIKSRGCERTLRLRRRCRRTAAATTGSATLDLDVIDAALAAGARAVLLCSPHNPTGRVFTAAELDALPTVVDRHGARVVSDEVHAALVYPGTTHTP